MPAQSNPFYVQPEKALEVYKAQVRIGARPIYEREAMRFLSRTKGDCSKLALMKYLNWMREENGGGYAPGTVLKTVVPTLRKLYRVNGVPWPLRTGEAGKLKEGDVYAPALEPTLVKRMIATAKTPVVSSLVRALLALSTTYGLRRIEMAQITKSRVDIDRGLIFVLTAKGGRERWHLIPPEIAPHIDIYWGKGLSDTQAWKAYRDIEQAAGIKRMRDVGWHAIRRILVRLLVEANLPGLTIDNYMRWKRGGADMQRLYYATQVVGERGQRVEVGRMDREVDERVFAVHPFLKCWSDENA